MERGEQVDKNGTRVIEQCYRAGRPIPKWISGAPSLRPGLSWIYQAFNQLSTERNGWGGGIPWSKIMEYADRLGLDADDRSDLLFFIREMDRAYQDHHNPDKGKSAKVGDTPEKGKNKGRIGGK